MATHQVTCPGPRDADTIVLTYGSPPDDCTCVCGHKVGSPLSLSGHACGCRQWWKYQRELESELPVKCEGCGRGFKDLFSSRGHSKICSQWQTWRAQKNLEEKTTPCPSCGFLMRGHQFGLHVNSCKGTFKEKDWEAWRTRLARERSWDHLRDCDPSSEGTEFVTCKICMLRFHQLEEHVSLKHGISAKEYRKNLGAPTRSKISVDRRIATMERVYGVQFWCDIPDNWEKAVRTFQRLYQVDHPLQLQKFKDKRIASSLAKYNVPHPMQCKTVQDKQKAAMQAIYGADYWFISDAFKEWSRGKYGTDHPMWNKQYVRELFDRISPSRPGPNGFEQRILDLDSRLIFTGNWTFWRYLPKLKGWKNPDFLVPGADPEHPRRGIKKVIEALGDYHHGKKVTGQEPDVHELELVEAYRDRGIECLVIWESQLEKDFENTKKRLGEFVCGAVQPLPTADATEDDSMDTYVGITMTPGFSDS